MARVPRLRIAGTIQHMTLRGVDGQPVFRVARDRAEFDRLVGAVLRECSARAHAYCWMTNHVHLVVEIGADRVEWFMAALIDRYTCWFRGNGGSDAPLFATPGQAARVAAEPYLLQLIRYVHLNPVRAGLVANAGDYPWSGHRAYLGYRGPAWLSTDLGLRLLGGDLLQAVAAYRAFVTPVGAEPAAEKCPSPFWYPARR